MKTLLAFVLVCSLGFAAADTPMKPLRTREVSLRRVPLGEGERIAAIEVEVAGARFRGVHIPDDWGVDVGAPASDVSILKGVAQHGTAMLFTTAEFQRFLTLAFYDYGEFNRPFTIKVKLVLYLYDKKKEEAERELTLASDCIVLEEPNQSLEPTPPSVTDRAAARSAPAGGVAHL